jgi:ABC-2 type transport system permease protein
MQQIRFLLYKEFLQFFRDKVMLRVIIVMPILMLLVLGFAVTTDVKNISIIICDQDHSAASRSLIEKISESGYFKIMRAEKGVQRLGQFLDSGEAKLGLVIPRHFNRDLLANSVPAVQIIINGEDAKSAQIAMGYIREIVTAFAQNIFFDQIFYHPEIAQNIHLVQPETRVWYNPNLESANFMVPGIVAMLITIFSMFFTALGIVREKETGTLEQLMVTPINSFQLIIGKTVPYVIISFTDAIFIMILARIIFNIPMLGSLWLLFGLMFVYILSTLGLGIFISTISQTQVQALFLCWFFMVVIFILSGFFIPIENMPRWIQNLSYLDPLRYLIAVIREIFLKGSGFNYLWQEGAAMLTFGVLILSLSVLRFQKRIK